MWNKLKDKIFEALEQVQVDNEEEYVAKMSIMMYLYKSLESEEVFNKNCNILNEALKDEKLDIKTRSRKWKK